MLRHSLFTTSNESTVRQRDTARRRIDPRAHDMLDDMSLPVGAHIAAVVRAGIDLMIPTTCGGCDAPDSRWCARCAELLADDPLLLRPRVAVGADVWALGRYRGPHRNAVIELKEHGRRDLAQPLGHALAQALLTLQRWGEIPPATRLCLVPAPTRPLAARRRGGDTVTAIADSAARVLGERTRVRPLLTIRPGGRDSAGLDARARRRNLSRRVAIRSPPTRTDRASTSSTILVDDVLTTGATAAESVRTLAEHGVSVDLVVVITAA